jgi:Cu2+-exporting ATPase/Cu+-exporting ATPase
MTKSITLPVNGMHCASCAISIEKTLSRVAGVEQCSVSYATEQASISYQPDQTNLQQLSERIKPLGYSLAYDTMTDHSEHLNLQQGKEQKLLELQHQARTAKIILPLTLTVFILMLWEILAQSFDWLPRFPISTEFYSALSFVIASIVMLWIGQPFIMGVVRFVRYRAANMDTLVGIGTLTAYIYSSALVLLPSLRAALGMELHTYFDVTIVVLGFVFLGKYMETKSKFSTGEAVEKLIGLQSKTAIVVRDNEEVEIPISEVVVGDTLIIKPGSKIPVDSVVISGQSAVDESMITGESIPVDKAIKDNLIGGTINKHGVLQARASKVGSATMLAQIIKMVEAAQGSRAPIQRLADQISTLFVPVVMIIAFLALLVWVVIGSQFMPANEAISFGIVSFVGVLVIACPCALGLATPTAIIVGTGKAAANGILIKDAASLELFYSVNTIVADKTGTITNGKPVVTDIVTVDNKLTVADALQIIASLEKNSEHPLASAILEHAAGLELLPVTNFRIIEGKGLTANINGQDYFAGNLKLVADLKLPLTDISELTKQGKTPVILMSRDAILAIIGIADTVKASAKETIRQLHQLGLQVVMLTGDNQNTAEYIANQVGIDQVIAEVLPQDKANKIKELQAAGRIVGMVGDGVNDAPALTQADVGIAMATGSDIAIESAQITLLGGDFAKLLQARKLSSFTMNAIKQNLFWAFAYNIIGIPLAAGLFYPFLGVTLNPAFAGLAMAFSSVSVIANSLRLKSKDIG